MFSQGTRRKNLCWSLSVYRARRGRMHDWACCTCDEHHSLERPQFEKFGIRKDVHLFWSCCVMALHWQTGNDIGDPGTASLSDSLKSNTTLTKLNLCCEDKRIHKRHSLTNHSFPFTFHKQTTTLEEEEQHHWVIHWNQTQHSLNSIWVVKTKERHTKDSHQQFILFLSHHNNREQH